MVDKGRRSPASASLAEIVAAQRAAFAAQYGTAPVTTVSAPGRINVIDVGSRAAVWAAT